jgi:hypothetical protein
MSLPLTLTLTSNLELDLDLDPHLDFNLHPDFGLGSNNRQHALLDDPRTHPPFTRTRDHQEPRPLRRRQVDRDGRQGGHGDGLGGGVVVQGR